MNEDPALQHELDRLRTRLPVPPPPARLLAQVARTRTRRRRRAVVAGSGVIAMLTLGVMVVRWSWAPSPADLPGTKLATGSTDDPAAGPEPLETRRAADSMWRAFGRRFDWNLADAAPGGGHPKGSGAPEAGPPLVPRPFRARDLAEMAAEVAKEREADEVGKAQPGAP